MNVISLMRCRGLWSHVRPGYRLLSTGDNQFGNSNNSTALTSSVRGAGAGTTFSATSRISARSLSWSIFGGGGKNGGERDEKERSADDAFGDAAKTEESAENAKLATQAVPFTSNTVISAERAQHFYLLQQEHLDQLESVLLVRSAYASGDREQMYPLSAVQAKSIEVWGSLANLHEQQRRRQELLDAEEMRQQIMRAFHHKTTKRKLQEVIKFDVRSDYVRPVVYAIGGNALVFLLKFVAYSITGSQSMLAEAFHSAFDVVNQSLLLVGHYKSTSSPSYDHPYGHTRQVYVYGLFSGFSLFFVGGIYNMYTGTAALYQPYCLESLHVAFILLGTSILVESATFYQAWRRVNQISKEAGMTFFSYVQHGSEATSVHVLTEDFFSLCGLLIAGIALSISHVTGKGLYDAGGMVVIGGLLSVASLTIIHRNQRMLVGKSIQPHVLASIIQLLEGDRLINSVHDTKGVVIGANAISFKAEILIDGRELAALTIARQSDATSYVKSMAQVTTDAQRQQLLFRFATDMSNELGEHIDQVEKAIKAKFPQVRHIDLEIL